MGLATRGKKKTAQNVRTSLDHLVDVLNKEEKLSLAQVAELCACSQEKAEELMKLLAAQNVCQIHFPAIGDPYLFIDMPQNTKASWSPRSKLILVAIASIIVVGLAIVLAIRFTQ